MSARIAASGIVTDLLWWGKPLEGGEKHGHHFGEQQRRFAAQQLPLQLLGGFTSSAHVQAVESLADGVRAACKSGGLCLQHQRHAGSEKNNKLGNVSVSMDAFTTQNASTTQQDAISFSSQCCADAYVELLLVALPMNRCWGGTTGCTPRCIPLQHIEACDAGHPNNMHAFNTRSQHR
jgi:hypothetical protein